MARIKLDKLAAVLSPACSSHSAPDRTLLRADPGTPTCPLLHRGHRVTHWLLSSAIATSLRMDAIIIDTERVVAFSTSPTYSIVISRPRHPRCARRRRQSIRSEDGGATGGTPRPPVARQTGPKCCERHLGPIASGSWLILNGFVPAVDGGRASICAMRSYQRIRIHIAPLHREGLLHGCRGTAPRKRSHQAELDPGDVLKKIRADFAPLSGYYRQYRRAFWPGKGKRRNRRTCE